MSDIHYTQLIKQLASEVPASLIDFSQPRDVARMPTQATSNFITNKEQGDWAEDVLFRAVNEFSDQLVAVRYGKADDIIAGDADFPRFFETYQKELDEIGKRPDLLLFRKSDYDERLGLDISCQPHDRILDYVQKGCGWH